MPIKTSGALALIADIEAEFSQGDDNVSLAQAGVDAGLDAGDLGMFEFYGLSDAVAPSVIILTPSSNISTSGFTPRGRITSDGGATITARGFYVGTSSTYTNNSQYSAGSGSGDFSVAITGLSAGTTYYIRPYATNSAGTTVGNGTTTNTSSPALSSLLGWYANGNSGTSSDVPNATKYVSGSSYYGYGSSHSHTISGYYSASNGASKSQQSLSGSFGSVQNQTSYTTSGTGSKYANVSFYVSGRNPTGGGYAECGCSWSKSGYSGFSYLAKRWNFSYNSDARLKTNINLVGQSPSGLNIYTFNYIDSKYGVGTFKGVLAHEVPEDAKMKDADGFETVDYSKLDVKFEKI